MNSFALFRVSRLPVFMRAGRVGLSLFALSLVLLVLAPIPAALAASKVPPARKQIDANGLAHLLGKGLIIMSPQVPLVAGQTVPAA